MTLSKAKFDFVVYFVRRSSDSIQWIDRTRTRNRNPGTGLRKSDIHQAMACDHVTEA